MIRIIIEEGNTRLEVDAELVEGPTADAIMECLPIESEVKTWGDEIYFDTGIEAPVMDATLQVDVGDIAYWPEGKCLCIFFGPTPESYDARPVPASEVVIVARTTIDPFLLREITPGATVTVSR